MGRPELELLIGIDADHPVSVVALVDSGADSTLIPRSLAPALGLVDSDLVACAPGSGVGSAFDAWIAPNISLHGVVAAYIDKGDGNGVQSVLWGPLFDLKPWFSDTGTVLLGREDFFAVFAITFGPGPQFHLDWDDPAPLPYTIGGG